MSVNFESALEAALVVVDEWVADGRLRLMDLETAGVFVGDALGRFALLLADDACLESAELLAALRVQLRSALGPHAFPGDAIAMLPGDHPMPFSILQDPTARRIVDHPRFRLLDRLQTNQDWLRKPSRVAPKLPLGVAYSIKGGVGRSTAFAVWALALARQGKSVLVVDLDLEAPGIGPLLLGDNLPAMGVVDWLVESLVDNAGAELLGEMLVRAPAAMDSGIAGDLRVIPAWGRDTRNYVTKLGRAYMPHGAGTEVTSFAGSLNGLLDAIALSDEPPDVVLMDARAGLHDIGAAAITQLGAQVFLFGRDEKQSWDAYKQLFMHLRNSPQIGTGDESDDLRLRLKMVAAMMDDLGQMSVNAWLNASYDSWLDIYDADGGHYSFDQGNEEAPHFPLLVAFNQLIKRFDFTADGSTQWPLIYPAFEGFVHTATALLLAESEHSA